MITKSKLGKKANFTFYQILSIGIVFLSLLLFLSVKLYSKLFLILDIFIDKIKSVCGCEEHLLFTSHPAIFTSLILLGVIIAAFFSFAIIKIIKIKWLTDKFVKNNLKNKKLKISKRLKKISAIIGVKHQIIELQNKKPIIFCFGLITPKICASSGFIKKLSNKELKAVLLHEQHHLFNKEPIKIFIVSAITNALFFLPGLKSFSKQYLTLSELAADQWATDDFRDKIPLAGALYKAIKFKKQMLTKNELALSFFSSPIMEERINKLANSKHKTKFKIFTSKLIIGLALFVFSFIIINKTLLPDNLTIAGHSVANCPGAELFPPQQQCIMLLMK